MTSHHPACPSRIMPGKLVGMALGAKAAREHLEHVRVLRAMGVMAFQAPLACQPLDRIVLVDEGSGDFHMTGDTTFLITLKAYGRNLS